MSGGGAKRVVGKPKYVPARRSSLAGPSCIKTLTFQGYL